MEKWHKFSNFWGKKNVKGFFFNFKKRLSFLVYNRTWVDLLVDDHQFGYTTQLKNKTLGIYQRKTNDRYFKNSFQTLLFGVNGGLFSHFFSFNKVESFKTHANKLSIKPCKNSIWHPHSRNAKGSAKWVGDNTFANCYPFKIKTT